MIRSCMDIYFTCYPWSWFIHISFSPAAAMSELLSPLLDEELNTRYLYSLTLINAHQNYTNQLWRQSEQVSGLATDIKRRLASQHMRWKYRFGFCHYIINTWYMYLLKYIIIGSKYNKYEAISGNSHFPGKTVSRDSRWTLSLTARS